MKKYLLLFLLLLLYVSVISQDRNSYWIFGDSAGINFSNLNNPIPIHSSMKSRGSCASVCDKGGNIKFYYGASADIYYFLNDAHQNGNIWNRNNDLMDGGDSIFTKSWYNEGVIIPSPVDTNVYYIFNIGVTSIFGLYYSVIDMTLDSSMGAVIQKNVQLENWEAVDCLYAVKHGNGNDWWVITKKANGWSGTNLNEWNLYLVNSTGIHPQPSQIIGSPNSNALGNLVFDKANNKLLYTNYIGLIELYDFDRCTGLLSNPTTIATETGPPFPAIWGSAISPSGQYLYVSTYDTVAMLYQYDLYSSNIPLSRITIDSFAGFPQPGGKLRLAPDNKIYYSMAWSDGINYNFPYPDSVYNIYNMNLSVINDPDQPGLACNFTPFSFYLGGKRTYWGLPNNPDYELGPLAGSACDTIVSISEVDPPPEDNLYVYPNPVRDVLFFTLPNKEKFTGVKMFDVKGKEVINISSTNNRINVTNLAPGVYFIRATTKDKVYHAKFVKREE